MRAMVLCAMAMMLVAAAPAGERVVEDTTLSTPINGDRFRLLIDPGAPAMPILSRVAAEQAELKAGPFGIGYRVGPVMVAGRSALGRIDVGGGDRKHRIGWTERPYAHGFDGVIGPGGLPEAIVRFRLRAPLPGERTIALPMRDGGGLFGSWGASEAVITVAGQPLAVRFNLERDATFATAGAALTLVEALGGTLDHDRLNADIAFGVKRPVRTLHLSRPLPIGPIAIALLSARTADFGNAEGIAATDAQPDPDEIVVTAKGKRDRHRDRITLGRAALAHCSAIVFDKTAKQIRLTCAPSPQS